MKMGKGRCGYGKMFKRDSDQGNHSWLPFHFHILPLYKRMKAENLPSLRAWLKREIPVQAKMSNENTMRHLQYRTMMNQQFALPQKTPPCFPSC